jgi:hypothetical protein
MKFSLRVVCASAILLLCPPAALACSCSDPGVRERFRAADYVFVGRVIEMSPLAPDDVSPLAVSLVKFSVEGQWKGSKKAEVTAVADFDMPGMCGDLNLAVGGRYLIYAPVEKGRLLVHADCGPNRVAEYAAGEIKQLRSFWFRLFARLYPYPKV